jgi:hypothetical protein
MIKNIINMYDKDFLKQLLHPKHLHPTPTSVKHNKRQIEKERNEFSINKLARNPVLRKGLQLTHYLGDQKETKEVNIKNADKDLMEHLQPKRYTSLLSSGDQGHVHSLKHIKSKQSKIKMPIRTIDKEIKVAKTHNMFDWFPMLVNKIHKDGTNVTDKLSTSPGEVVKQLKLGNENLYSYIKPDGSIKINVQSPHASNIHPETKMGSFSMEYDPPKISLDKHADVAMHIPASFKFIENNREVHPNNATSDTLPLESKLTGRHISALRNDKK